LLGRRARARNADYESIAGGNHGHLVIDDFDRLVAHPHENRQEPEHEREHEREHEKGHRHGHAPGHGHGHRWEP